MAGTMEKADVKLEYLNIKQVKWDAVQKTVGKSVPALAREAVDDAIEKVEEGELKKPYVKIGKIGNDLYLRIKDGSKHVQDVKLASNWVEPGQQAQGQEDPEYQRKLEDYIAKKDQAREAGKRALAAIKQKAQEADDIADQAEGIAGEAERGADAKGDGVHYGAARTAELAQRIETLQTEAQESYDDFFEEYDKHRTGEKGQDIRQEDKGEYVSQQFVMRVLRPLDISCKDGQKAIASSLKRAQDAAEEAREWNSENKNAVAAYTKRATALREEAESELEAAKRVLGNQGDIDTVANSLETIDLTGMQRAQTDEERDRYSGQAGQRMKLIVNGNNLVKGRITKLLGLTKKLSAIPKQQQGNGTVKDQIDQFKAVLVEGAQFKKTWDKGVKTAMANYAKIKAAMS